jgi:hypothetical protein
MKTKKVRTDKEIADSFEQDEYKIKQCIEYYVGVNGFSVEIVNHPDHLWTILDRIDSDLAEEARITEEQQNWLRERLGKWMREIEPYCVRLESE